MSENSQIPSGNTDSSGTTEQFRAFAQSGAPSGQAPGGRSFSGVLALVLLPLVVLILVLAIVLFM